MVVRFFLFYAYEFLIFFQHFLVSSTTEIIQLILKLLYLLDVVTAINSITLIYLPNFSVLVDIFPNNTFYSILFL